MSKTEDWNQMANDKEIKIGISTTADTAGIDKATGSMSGLDAAATTTAATSEKMTQSISRVPAALTAEQAALDLTEAKLRKAERAAKAQTTAHSNLGIMVNQVGYQVTDFATQVQMGTSTVTAFSQQMPQALAAIQQFGGGAKLSFSTAISGGTALSLVGTALALSIGLAVKEWDKMRAEQKKAEEGAAAYAKQLERMREAQELLRQQGRMDFIVQNYQEAADALERQVTALSRINELRAAQGGAEAAAAQAAITIAQNTGGNVLGARADAVAVGANNQLDELQSKLATSEAAVATATQGLDKATGVLAELRLRGDIYGDAYKAADAAFEKATTDKNDAVAELENQRQIFEFAKQAIISNTGAELNTLSTETQAAATKSAEETRAAVIAKIQETGGNVSSSLKDALTGLNTMLADREVKPDEMARFTDTLNRVRISNESKDVRILKGLESMLAAQETFLNRLPAAEARIDTIMGRIEQLEARP